MSTTCFVVLFCHQGGVQSILLMALFYYFIWEITNRADNFVRGVYSSKGTHKSHALRFEIRALGIFLMVVFLAQV